MCEERREEECEGNWVGVMVVRLVRTGREENCAEHRWRPLVGLVEGSRCLRVQDIESRLRRSRSSRFKIRCHETVSRVVDRLSDTKADMDPVSLTALLEVLRQRSFSEIF
jgi:hypothetical protein